MSFLCHKHTPNLLGIGVMSVHSMRVLSCGAQSLRSADGLPISNASAVSVRQHLRTALGLVHGLIIDSGLETRLTELQPYIQQTLRDVHPSVPLNGKAAVLPAHCLKVRYVGTIQIKCGHPGSVPVLTSCAPRIASRSNPLVQGTGGRCKWNLPNGASIGQRTSHHDVP